MAMTAAGSVVMFMCVCMCVYGGPFCFLEFFSRSTLERSQI